MSNVIVNLETERDLLKDIDLKDFDSKEKIKLTNEFQKLPSENQIKKFKVKYKLLFIHRCRKCEDSKLNVIYKLNQYEKFWMCMCCEKRITYLSKGNSLL